MALAATTFLTSNSHLASSFLFFTCCSLILNCLHRGTLQVESGDSQMEEWSLKSCHIRLHRTQPPLTLFLQIAKCLMECWRPSHVENLLQGALFLLGSLSYGPTLVQPSVQICCKQSIASLSWKYKLCSWRCFLVRFLLCTFRSNSLATRNLQLWFGN